MTDSAMFHGPFIATKREYRGADASHHWLWIDNAHTTITLHGVPNPRAIASAINPADTAHGMMTMLDHALEQIALGNFDTAQEAIMSLREIAAATCDCLCDMATPDQLEG